jgi:alkanesulfonate monooxygenase SsuD/methylene tetrahydromethanopterin reductase-like flavin-dependent oxidoreductase (luciferase family)
MTGRCAYNRAMPPFQTGVFFLPSIGTRRQMEAGMAGRDPALYSEMLADLRELAITADDLGYDAIAFTEHHFHIEGFEISNNPVLLDAYIAQHTKRIRVGQLGIVLPASSPLRVAEDIAMLDHMSNGRAFAGFARGYQRRWVDTLAQQYHSVHAAPSGDPATRDAEVDRVNRAAFEEFFDIVRLAWTKDTFSYKGNFWQVPPPDIPWTLSATETMGRGVRDGMVTEIGVVPKPIQQPHPPIMQPFSFSEPTIRWCARQGVQPILAPVNDQLEEFLFRVYHEEANAHGRELAPGEGIGVLRDVVVADTDEQAWELWHDSGQFVGAAWFAPFGFGGAIPRPGEDPRSIDAKELHARNLIWVGSPDTVRRQIRATLDRLPLKYVMAWQYNGLMPRDTIAHSLRLYQDIGSSV